MKNIFPHIAIATLCGWFGITRQAYYQSNWNAESKSIEQELILKEVIKIRKKHPRMGVRKLYKKLSFFKSKHRIKMGRDALFDLLSSNNLLIKKRKRRVQTTQSFHWLKKYPNLVKDFIPSAVNKLWVSDITYWKIENGKFIYISLITDAFSHKIVGFHVAESLRSIETRKALKMALHILSKEEKSNIELIHHSDRGVQYCSHQYVKLLKKYKIKISMTESGDPRENAIAERINGILKEEYLYDYIVNNIKEAKKILNEVVKLYNEDRPHNSIENLTPNQVHIENIKRKKLWKNYYKKIIVKEQEQH